jgi:hypothetical protein
VNRDRATNDMTVGTAAWVHHNDGCLTSAERRALLWPLARTHVANVVGRLRLGLGLHPGRRAYLPAARLVPPNTALTRTARACAIEVLTVPLLNHSFRAYRFGRALGELEGLDVDEELLFAAAMLHDTGLVAPPASADFTLASSRFARQVADQVGLSRAATDTLETAITMHHSPGVTLSAGPEAYLLSAGAAVDVVGLRAWDLPDGALREAVDLYPRADFKQVFTAAFRQEAARVPDGRARFLHRYGAFAAAIKFAPFDE